MIRFFHRNAMNKLILSLMILTLFVSCASKKEMIKDDKQLETKKDVEKPTEPIVENYEIDFSKIPNDVNNARKLVADGYFFPTKGSSIIEEISLS